MLAPFTALRGRRVGSVPTQPTACRAETLETAGQPLSARQERKCLVGPDRGEDAAADGRRIADTPARRGDHYIAAPAQILAAIAAAETRRAREQHDRGDAAGADENVEPGAADADRAGRRHDLIGLRLRLAADPAERPACSVERELVEGLRAIIDEPVYDNGRIAADGELGAVGKPELAKPAGRGLDAFVTVNRRPDGNRPAGSRDRCTNKRGLADLLLRVGGKHRCGQNGRSGGCGLQQ